MGDIAQGIFAPHSHMLRDVATICLSFIVNLCYVTPMICDEGDLARPGPDLG